MRVVTRHALLYACALAAIPGITRSQDSVSKAATSKKVRHKPDPRYAVYSGSWSAATISLFNTWTALDHNPGRHISCFSPDHKKEIEVIETDVTLRVSAKTFETDLGSKHDTELGWAPDSSRFFVTWTETGELGLAHAGVCRGRVWGSRISRRRRTSAEDFEARVRGFPIPKEFRTPEGRQYWENEEYCEPYHVIGARWVNGSKELLVSVLVENVGICRYMSEFNVYRVEAETGKVLQRYTAVEAHKKLGERYLPLIAR